MSHISKFQFYQRKNDDMTIYGKKNAYDFFRVQRLQIVVSIK